MLLGIDASQLLTERFGIARHVQSVIDMLAADTRVQTTLLAPRDAVDALAMRYAHSSIQIAPLKAARRDHFDAVWYPCNTVGFPTKSAKILSIHDVFALTDPSKNFFTRRREKKALRYSARAADQIIVSSTWMQQQVAGRLKVAPERLSIIRPAPDTAWHPALDPLPFPDLTGMPFIVVAADERGPHHLKMFFDAFAHAFKKRHVRLVFCGRVPHRLLKAFKKLPHAVALMPDDAQLRALYRNAAAVAVPAGGDGFSFIAGEASACGAAVLGAKAAAFPEYFAESAQLIDPARRRRWTDALENVVEDEVLNARLRAQAVGRWSGSARSNFVDELIAVANRANSAIIS